MIESKSSRVYGAIFLVYVLPIVLAVLGYALAASLGAPEGGCILATFAGIILGGAVVVLRERLGKKDNAITFDIISLQ